jgi:hypothetical protein
LLYTEDLEQFLAELVPSEYLLNKLETVIIQKSEVGRPQVQASSWRWELAGVGAAGQFGADEMLTGALARRVWKEA